MAFGHRPHLGHESAHTLTHRPTFDTSRQQLRHALHRWFWPAMGLFWLVLLCFLWWYPWTPQTSLRPSPIPGFVIFRITPSEARLRIQGQEYPAPAQGISLPHGSYQIDIHADGYFPHTETLVVEGDDAKLVRIRLRPRSVEIHLLSKPNSARLFLQDRLVGLTPYRGPQIPGLYTMRLEKAGYVSISETLEIKPKLSPQRFVFRLGGYTQPRMQDGAWMHWIPGTSFLRGSHAQDIRVARQLCLPILKQLCPEIWFSAEIPQRRITLPSFWMDRTEVTLQQYQRCVQAKICQPPRYTGLPQHPVTGVTWHQASAYCRWIGGRLPTEAEWELAAHGPLPRSFPWGERWDTKACNHGTFSHLRRSSQPDRVDGFEHAAPVGQFPQGRSPYRLLDMAGNVAEWVADCYHTSYYRQAPTSQPWYRVPHCISHPIRGGSWLSPPWEVRTTSRQPMPPDLFSLTVGFRCMLPERKTSNP